MGSLQIAYPEIGGSGEQQLLGIKKYLFQLTEQLNLADWSASAVFTEAGKAIDAASLQGAGENETANKLSEYSALRSLIIKTADYAIGNSEQINIKLESSLKAISDFGTLTEDLSNKISLAADGIEQLYDYSAGINNEQGEWSVGSKQYIKTGLLYYDSGLPVYGVGVGIISTKFENNEEVIDIAQNKLATFTAEEIAFWQQGSKVAYITAGAINFPAAHITGGSINIGDGNFTVTNNGVLTATGVNISGTINATAGTIGGCRIINGVLQVPEAQITSISADKITGGTLNFNNIYVSGTLSASTISGGTLNCSNLTISGLSVTSAMIASLSTTKLTGGNCSQISNMYVSYSSYFSAGGFRGINSGGTTYTFVARQNDSTMTLGQGFSSGTCTCYVDLIPLSNVYKLGTSTTPWRTAYFNIAPTITSDRKDKKDIADIGNTETSDIVRGLRPVSYKIKNAEDGATHYGFVAQEVESVLAEAEATGNAIVSKAYIDSAHTELFTKYGLRYEEFIPLITKFIQSLDSRVTALESL